MPTSATWARVRLYYQSTSKEFVEFLRDENTTNTKGQELYDLWATNGMCPPVVMAYGTWYAAPMLFDARTTPSGAIEIEFHCEPGKTYTIEFTDNLPAGVPATWDPFVTNGTLIAVGTTAVFTDDFTANTSGGFSTNNRRFYRVKTP